MNTCKRWIETSAVVICFGCFLALSTSPAAEAQDVPVPIYKVDPYWPKRLPHKWSSQQFVDIYVTKDDHIWAENRSVDAKPDELGAMLTPPQGECCVLGPEIVEFDIDGNVLKGWGGPNYVPGWPDRLQTITVDREENVWVMNDRPGISILKFSSDGKFLWDFGHNGPKPTDVKGKSTEEQRSSVAAARDLRQTDILYGGATAFDIDDDARELYVADSAGKRILVYDEDTGAFKRGWGGHGMPLSEIDTTPPADYDITGPPPDEKNFVPTLHCVHISVDGLVYVCERNANRISVFTKQGKFVTSIFVHPSTPARGKSCGGLWSTVAPMCGVTNNLTFSHDPQEKYILVADATDDMVWIVNRSDGKEVGSFGGNGHYAGQLRWPDSIAMDSWGNVYVGEVEDGKRIQKFSLTNGGGKKTQPRPTPVYK